MWQCPECGLSFVKNNQYHNCNKTAAITTIKEYIKVQPKDTQVILKKICKVIRSAAPEAIEKITWRMPTFWQKENIIHFAAFKKHIGIYPGSEAIEVFAKDLTGYKTSKGAIQFPLDKPIDYDLISKITSWRIKNITQNINK